MATFGDTGFNIRITVHHPQRIADIKRCVSGYALNHGIQTPWRAYVNSIDVNTSILTVVFECATDGEILKSDVWIQS